MNINGYIYQNLVQYMIEVEDIFGSNISEIAKFNIFLDKWGSTLLEINDETKIISNFKDSQYINALNQVTCWPNYYH